jgi:hypothetical protein
VVLFEIEIEQISPAKYANGINKKEQTTSIRKIIGK